MFWTVYDDDDGEGFRVVETGPAGSGRLTPRTIAAGSTLAEALAELVDSFARRYGIDAAAVLEAAKGNHVCSVCGGLLYYGPFGAAYGWEHLDASEAADCWNVRGDRDAYAVLASDACAEETVTGRRIR